MIISLISCDFQMVNMDKQSCSSRFYTSTGARRLDQGYVKVPQCFYVLHSRGAIPPIPQISEINEPPPRPSAPPCQHQQALVPLKNKCLLRTGPGVHLQPAPVTPHEGLGPGPGEAEQEGAGVLQPGWGGGGGVAEGAWEGAGSELEDDLPLG